MVDQDQRTRGQGGQFDDGREGFANHPHYASDVNASVSDNRPGSSRESIRNEMSGRFDRARDFINRGVGQVRDQLRGGNLMNKDMMNKVSEQARSNPWVHIGLAGVGGLILGYVVGKSSVGSFAGFAENEDIEEDL